MSLSKIRLLLINPYPIFPVSAGGKKRTLELARHLSHLGVDVSILTPFHYSQKRKLFKNETFRLIQIVYPFVAPLLFTDRPFPYMYLISFHPGFVFLTNQLLKSFHVYQFEHAAFADLADYIPLNKPIIYDAHNVEYDYVRMECKSRIIEKIASQRIFELESKLLDRASHVFTCSMEDKYRFNELYNTSLSKFSLAPNGVNLITFNHSMENEKAMFEKFPQLKQFSRRAIFSGADVEHNRIAVKFILEHLAPSLQNDYAFVIHGGCGRIFQKRFYENVFFDLDLEFINFKIYACDGTVALNPVTHGSGTNLKILQYLAYGLPVISTDFGVRGYADLEQYVKVASLENFVNTLRQPLFRQSLNHLQFLERYRWQNIAEQVKAIYDSLL